MGEKYPWTSHRAFQCYFLYLLKDTLLLVELGLGLLKSIQSVGQIGDLLVVLASERCQLVLEFDQLHQWIVENLLIPPEPCSSPRDRVSSWWVPSPSSCSTPAESGTGGSAHPVVRWVRQVRAEIFKLVFAFRLLSIEPEVQPWRGRP